MLQPNVGYLGHLDDYPYFAVDTGCYSPTGSSTFDLWGYFEYLTGCAAYRERCLFASAPDVVGDAQATWHRSRDVLSVLRELGFRAALVAQDGLESLSVDWEAFDVLFVGGSTQWKLSPAAYSVVEQAKAQGKWVHMGRVNTFRRLQNVKRDEYDSADGTLLAFGPGIHLPRLLNWMGQLEAQTMFEIERSVV